MLLCIQIDDRLRMFRIALRETVNIISIVGR